MNKQHPTVMRKPGDPVAHCGCVYHAMDGTLCPHDLDEMLKRSGFRQTTYIPLILRQLFGSSK